MLHIKSSHRRPLAFAGVVAFALGVVGISVGSTTVSAHPSELAGEVIETTSHPDPGHVSQQLASAQQCQVSQQVSQQDCQQEIILFPVQDVYVDLVLPHQEHAHHQQQKHQHHKQQHHHHHQQQAQCFTGTWAEVDPSHTLTHPAQAEALLD